MAAPAFVQSNTTVGGTGLTTLNCAFSSNNTAGDMLLCTVRFLTSNGSGTPTMTITDSQGNVGWTPVAPLYSFAGSSNFSQAFYLLNCKGGANTVTVTITGGTGLSGFIRMGVGEWSGVAAFDQAGAVTQTQTTAFTPTGITTVAANELILGFDWQVQVGANPTSIGGGFTQRINDSGVGDVVVADFVGGPITPTTKPTFNWAGNNTQAGYMASFFNQVFSISGNVTVNGVATSGVPVNYSGTMSGSVSTDGSGNYTISGLIPGTYTVTPSLDGEIFFLGNSVQTISGSNVTAVNFAATTKNLQIGVWAYRGVVVAPVSSDTPGQPNVLYESGAKILTPNADGNIFKMWFGSANGMCYAESNDGLVWTRYGSNPVLVPTGSAPAGWNAYPRIFKNSGTYYAYIVNKSFQSMSSWTSTDGVTWAQRVANAITPNQTWSGGATPQFIGQLSVAGQVAGTWYGYYTAFDSGLNEYVIGQATSTDLLNWTSQASPVLTANSPSNFCFQTLGKVVYGWTQIVQPNIPHFGTNGIPSDITRYSATSPAGPFTPLTTPTLYRINSAMGVGSVLGQVADPSVVTVNGTTYIYATVTATGNGAPTNYQIACFTAPLSLQQLVETYEGVSGIPMPGTTTGFAAQLNTLATDPFTAGDTNWTTISTASGGTGGTWGAPTFHNGSASGTTNGVRGAAYFTALGSAAADQWSSITLSSVNSNSFVGAICRASTSGAGTAYTAVIGGGTLGSSGTAQLFVQKFVNNAFTTLYQSGFGSALHFSVGDVITLSAVGNTLSVYQNGNLLIVVYDTDIASGAPGFSCTPDATVTDAAISGFSAGNFAYTIGGSVGVAGATVSDGTLSATSDANGTYILGPETAGTKTITPTKSGVNFSPLSQQVVVGSQNAFVNWLSNAYSVPDCRVAPFGPNASRNVNGTLIYDVQTSSNHSIPPTDSRTAGPPVASGTYPQNSRTPGTYGPGE